MNLIFDNTSKFQQIGPIGTNDNTANIEAKTQRRLLQLLNGGVMPKVHKKEVPLRPILSMVGSLQHALAKYLAAVIDPVLQLYSNNCMKDSLTFAKEMQDLQMHPKKHFFAHSTFAVCSLMFL